MTIWVKRASVLGSVVVLSASLATGCGGGTATGSGPDSPSDTGGKSGKKRKQRGEQKGAKAEMGDGTSGVTAAADVPELPLPDPGVQGEENRSMGAKMNLTLEDDSGAAAGLLDKSWSLAEDRRVMVEKVGDTAVTQYSLLFGERKTSGLDSWSKLPTEGKGYTVARKGGALSILDNGKTEASDEEREVIEAEYGFIGKPNPLKLAILRAEESGEQTLEAAAYDLLLGYVPEVKVKTVTITHTGDTEVEGRAAHELEVTATGQIPDGDITYDFEIQGPAVVDAKTGWTTSLVLEGKLEVEGKVSVKNKEMNAHGKGTLEMERKATIN